MGFLDCFTYKSTKRRKYDSNQYIKWAFPYGDDQKERIESLLKELTNEKPQIALSTYLIGKEAAIGDWQDASEGIKKMSLHLAVKPIKRVLQTKNEDDVSIYLALIEADFHIDESLNYPSVETIEKRAKEIIEELKEN